jgi:hypothetical protein
MGVQRQELPDKDPMAPKPAPGPKVVVNSPYYKAKEGFANYYFNEQARDKLVAAFKKHGDFSKLGGDWVFRGKGTIRDAVGTALIAIKYKGAKDGVNDTIVGTVGGIDQNLEPLKTDIKIDDLKEPIGSGGLLIALYSATAASSRTIFRPPARKRPTTSSRASGPRCCGHRTPAPTASGTSRPMRRPMASCSGSRSASSATRTPAR